ncbi:MAG TPA: adenylate/guanylate cyclase domain-containing protein [Stellaceae bacterium]|nr:adenylate/guanylate cyclase domain-containing protein [Stellaceae bacterium]
MGEAASLRKLTAILAADVSGYSRMMRADQSGTIDRLAVRREILDDAVSRHQGRIVNTAGDSVLAEFGSVVDALHCALEIQATVAQENQHLPRERQMSFRIGVHTGEVFVRGSDLLGDGINVAARLQSLAPPGGIYTSAVVREQVRGIISLQFEDKGQQRLKNIDRSVRVFAVASATSGEPVHRERGRRWFTGARIAAVLAFCLIVGSTEAVWRLHPTWLERWLPDAGGKESAPLVPAPPPASVARSSQAPVAMQPKPALAASPPATASAQSTAVSGDAIELALWQSTTTQGTQSAYGEYLRQYPSGHFAEAAKAQIETLKRAQQSDTTALAPAHVPAIPPRLAQGISFECPKPGTIIAFSDGQRLTFGNRAGYRCQAVGKDGKEADEYAGLVSMSALPSLAAADLEKFWPLKEHAELAFETRSPEFFSGAFQQDWVSNRYRVVGTEHLHLPAGDFDTVLVERHLRARNFVEDIDVTQRLWYAPKVAYVVKIETDRGRSMYVQGALPAHVEATEITLP